MTYMNNINNSFCIAIPEESFQKRYVRIANKYVQTAD